MTYLQSDSGGNSGIYVTEEFHIAENELGQHFIIMSEEAFRKLLGLKK